MRKLFILMLFALLLGVGVVALIETDPGYVLLSYGQYTVETSLWVGLLLVLIFYGLVYLTLRLIRRLIGGQNSVISWLGARKSRKSARMTNRGLISFIEGNWDKSRRQLLRGAKHNEVPLLNYIMAARASQRLNETDKVREYLGAAADSESEAGIAVELTQAEMKLHSGQYEQAVATLVRARRNAGRHPYVLELLSRAYLALQDWDNLSALLPELKKYRVLSEADLAALERNIYVQLLQQSVRRSEGDAVENLHKQWQMQPATLRRDRGLVHTYVLLLINHRAHDAADKVIVRAIKQEWDSELARLYGLVESSQPGAQLSAAESWLDGHGDDPQLLLTLGRLAARDQLWGKARDYFERAYALDRSPEVCAELARLLDALGEERISSSLFREGLLSREMDLPPLPLPSREITKLDVL